MLKSNSIEVQAARDRAKVHPSITEEQINTLVDGFYGVVQKDAELGPIFQQHVANDWDAHLPKMKAFWRSVLLRSGEYKGKPVPVHQKIDGLGTDQFQKWLDVFRDVAKKSFNAEAADLVIEAAERIATSLWLSRHTDPFLKPPQWRSIDAHPEERI